MFPVEQLSSALSVAASNPTTMSKVAAETERYIRDHLREDGVFPRIIQEETIKPGDPMLRPATHNDTMTYLVEVEPETRGMSSDFRGTPNVQWLYAPRAELGFYTVLSPRFAKNEDEMMAYRYSLTRVVEENILKDMLTVVDRHWFINMELAVQAVQAEKQPGGVSVALNAAALQGATPPVEASVTKGELARIQTGAAGATSYPWPIQKPDIVLLLQSMHDNELETKRITITRSDRDGFLMWTMEDTGSKLVSETTVEGYKYATICGYELVITIKNKVLRRGNVYATTDAEFLGRNLLLQEPKFYMEKRWNVFQMQAWKIVAQGLLNVAAVRKLELYSGDASPLDTDGILSAVSPLDEELLNANVNRIEEGINFPYVAGY
jgi:hypothetical protein